MASLRAPMVALSWTALSGGPSDVENAAISSTGVYYAIGNNDYLAVALYERRLDPAALQ